MSNIEHKFETQQSLRRNNEPSRTRKAPKHRSRYKRRSNKRRTPCQPEGPQRVQKLKKPNRADALKMKPHNRLFMHMHHDH